MVNAGTTRLARKQRWQAADDAEGVRGGSAWRKIAPLHEHTALEQTCMPEGSLKMPKGASTSCGGFRSRLFLGIVVLASKGRLARRPCVLCAPMPAGRLRRRLRRSDDDAGLQLRKSGTAFKASRQVRPFYS